MAAANTSAHTLRRAWLTDLARRTDRDLTSWRTAAVDAVAAACAADVPDGDTVETALRTLAAERAATGGSLDEVLTELEALWSLLDPRRRPSPTEVARALVTDAWVDEIATRRGTPTVDRLTGLHTPGYLVGRVYELDRIAGDGEVRHLVLLVVRWHQPSSPWLRTAISTQVADALRHTVRREATLCRLGDGSAAALVPDDGDARFEMRRLTRVLEAEPASTARVTSTLVPVPDHRPDLDRLLQTLLEPPPEKVVTPPSQLRMRAAE